MQILKTSLVFLFSLILRLWLTPKLDYGTDQKAIFELGRNFYETGIIPAEGPKLVYTGESIPGGFQAIMAGLPLFFSQGEPIGLQLWVGILNWAAMLLLFLWLRTKVKFQQETLLAVFIAFSPWSLLFSPAWNPSFLPIFAVSFFWILERATTKEIASKKREAYVLGLVSVLCLQLHLSAVLLALAVVIALPLIQNRVRFILSAVAGGVTGAVFLVPWFLKKIDGSVSAPTGVVGIHFENISDIPKAFFRYTSFSTAEVSRFLTPQGHGFHGMLGMLKDASWLWVPALISLVGSGVLVFLFLKRWVSLRSQLMNGFTRVEFLLPLFMTVTFLFSIKGASAHTFWILMPLSFYSMVRTLATVSGLANWMGWVYLLHAIIFAVGGYVKVQSLS